MTARGRARLRHRQPALGAEGARARRAPTPADRRPRLVARRRRRRAARGRRTSGACMEALRAAGLDDVAVDAIALGPAVPRDLRRDADALRGLRRVARRPRARRAARGASAACPRASSARRCSGTCSTSVRALGHVRRPAPTRRGSTSCTPTPLPTVAATWSPPATTAARSSPRSSAARCGPPSSTPRSPARPASPSSAASSPALARAGDRRGGLMDSVPRHRPARRPLRAPLPGRLRPGDRLRRRPGRPRPGPSLAAGAPWIHVVDLDAARTGEPVEPGA